MRSLVILIPIMVAFAVYVAATLFVTWETLDFLDESPLCFPPYVFMSKTEGNPLRKEGFTCSVRATDDRVRSDGSYQTAEPILRFETSSHE